MIRRCAELHMRQIAHGGDPFETGSARPLDYGHWSAHKLESADPASPAPRRGGGDRHGARCPLLGARGPAGRGPGGADLRAARAPGLPPLASRRSRSARPDGEPCDPRGPAGVPRAPRRRAHGDAARRTSARGIEVHEIDEARMLAAIDLAEGARAARHEARRRPELGHLTYCTNIHPGETWPEVRASARAAPARGASASVAPDQPFGVGLRLSAVAAAGAARARGAGRAEGASRRRSDCYVFTINGFPYGPFHGRRSRSRSTSPTGATRSGWPTATGSPTCWPSCCRTTRRWTAASAPCPGRSSRSPRRRARSSDIARNLVRHAAHLVRHPRAHRADHRARARARALLLPRDDRRDRALLRAAPVRRRRGPPARASSPVWRAAMPRPRCGATSASATTSATPRSSSRTRRASLRALQAAGHRRAEAAAERGAAHRRGRAARPPRSCARSTSRSTSTRWSSARGDRLTPLPRPAGGAGRRSTDSARRRVAGAFPRADLPRRAEGLLDHPGVPRARSWRCTGAQPISRAPRGRDLHLGRAAGALSRRSTWRARSRASSPGCSSSSTHELARRAAARPGLQPADGLDQHARRHRARRRRRRRSADRAAARGAVAVLRRRHVPERRLRCRDRRPRAARAADPVRPGQRARPCSRPASA